MASEIDLLNYDQSIALKDLGFDQKLEPGDYYYTTIKIRGKHKSFLLDENEDLPAENYKPVRQPTYDEAFRFFREKFYFNHSIHTPCEPIENGGRWFSTVDNVYDLMAETSKGCESYEETRKECLNIMILNAKD